MPIICTACGGIVRGGLCLPCDLREKNLYNYDLNAYSFNNSNYFPQPQDENYLCNLCGNNSHDDYDCQQQFSFVYEHEPSYNQNYDDNYYPHQSLCFPCCDFCGGSHETFQCQPDNQNVDFSGSDQIQTPPPSSKISNEEIFQAKGDLMKAIQTFLERFNCIPFEEKPQNLFQTWETFFAIQCSQPEDSNELFQKLLKILKELAEYDQSTSTDRPIFLNSDEGHSVQDKESLENPFNKIAISKPDNESDLELEVTTDTELSSTKDIHPLVVQEPPQDFDIRQLIREECCVEVPEEQKQKMEDMMFELVKICQAKEFLCIHDDVDDLIESALDSKLLLINSNCQHLDKKEQEVKNVVDQPAERGNRSIQSLQNFKNFKVVHKSSTSLNNSSQISSILSVAPIQSTKEPKHLLCMGYEHLNITPETKSDEVIESNAENLLPIQSKCEVTLENEIECDMPANDDCSPVFATFSNPLFKDNDDLDSSDDESLPDEDVPAEEFKIYSNALFDEDEINSDKLDPHCFNVESDFVKSLLNRDTFIDFSSKFDFSGELAHIKPEIPKSNFDFKEEICLIENLLYDNSFPRPPEELNAEIADTIIESIPLLHIPVQDGNSQQEKIDILPKQMMCCLRVLKILLMTQKEIFVERTKKLHNDKIKNRIFNVGDQVLLFNSRLKIFSRKLKSRWSGPFTISEIYPYGTAKLIHPDGCNFKVNCHKLKHYHGGDPPPLEIPNVTTFPKDN
nr:reverse transcriptase domain-containing protein [Tanacetum cinerariifolium]